MNIQKPTPNTNADFRCRDGHPMIPGSAGFQPATFQKWRPQHAGRMPALPARANWMSYVRSSMFNVLNSFSSSARTRYEH